MKKNIVLFILTLVIFTLGQELYAQCPMCSLSAGTNLKDGGTAAKGLNIGILFMLSMPYLLVATFIFFLVKRFKKDAELESSES